MTNIALLVIVVSQVGVGIGAIGTIVMMAGGDDAADGKVALGMGVRAQLAGVPMCVTVGAMGVSRVRKGEGSSKGIMVPGTGHFIGSCSGVGYDGFAEGHGGM